MFRFDEPAVEEQFRDRFDELLPGAMLMRPKRSKKTLPPKMGLKVLVLDKLEQNKDALKIIMRQITDAMASGVAKLYGSTSRVFIVGLLEFEYTKGEFDVGGEKKEPGTEVKVTASVEEA